MDVRIAEIAALLIVVMCAVHGRNKGLLLELFSLGKIILIIVLTFVLSGTILPRIPEYIPERSGVAYSIAVILASIITAFVDLAMKQIKRIPVLSTLDRVGGVLIGIVIGLAVDWLAIVFILRFGNMTWAKPAADAIRKSYMLSGFLQLKFW